MCDILVALPAASAIGATLFAKNSDRPPAEQQVVEWSPERADERVTRCTHIEVAAGRTATLASVLSRPQWCWGAEHGVNEAGVAAGNTTVYTTLDPRGAPVGLTGMDLVRLALERATSAAAAVEVVTEHIERYGQGGSGHDPALVPAGRPYWSSFLVADPATAFVIDTSGREWAVEQVDDVRAISNRTTIPAFDAAHRHPRQPVEGLVDPRWHASQRALANRPVTVDGVQRHLRSHDSCGDEGWSVCMHVDGVECTTASMIAALRPRGESTIWALTGHPCEQEYVELSFAEAAGGELSRVRRRAV
jgi:hypothetical protein